MSQRATAGTTITTAERTSAVPTGARKAYAALTGIATLFVFVQFFTSSEFIRAKGDTEETWTDIHGWTAYGLLVPALLAAVVAVVALRRVAPVLTVVAVVLFVASVGQWGSGHLISTLGMDGWTPFHVFFSSVVLALAVWASIRSAVLRRG
ncbi:hypothetical protein [Amnibacterium kyonggiense]|uniref:Uncharacterized protein n=1 Tax=Amnibacterium kyonggiense TaxID=595671 RepID=A0A4R7FT63_9MICO|nr:hypothetical protein [Amnibacterium kyonggiense]TDS81063.1 hypothetical protein CLV52_1637 [Amnibacterium kyonggiense]